MRSDLLLHDMHSHLLPALDDGAKHIEDSLSLIRQLSALGYKKLITTPHVISGLYYNSAETIFPALEILRAAVEKEGIPIELDAAAEYMMDDYFETLLEDKTPLLTINGKYVLVEFSYVAHPPNYRTIFFDLKMAGYEPILAHPERYMYLHQQFEIYRELFETGILLQVNLLSLMGYYGSRVQKVAMQLLEEGLVHFIGSDVHHQKHIDTISGFEMNRSLEKLFDKGLIRNEQL